MRALVVGSGGREHAIAWALHKDPRVTQIYCAPGNGGTGQVAQNIPVESIDVDGLISFARQNSIDIAVIGPEAPLALGIVDELQKAGIKAFGPTQKGARIETSKVWAKEFMARHGIPTARHEVFHSLEGARDFVHRADLPVVIKLDGLAAGKGVLVAKTEGEAEEFFERVAVGEFGAAGQKIIVEEFLEGREVSLLAFTDGHNVVPMEPARDYKRAYDDDLGPNTGGMGAVSPVPDFGTELRAIGIEKILFKAVNGLRSEGIEYKGVLYAGLIVTKDGPKVLEFNCRFGDPETQVLLPRLKTPLLDVLLSVVDERLSEIQLEWENRISLCVVAASKGYPQKYRKGLEIIGLDAVPEEIVIFHAGTTKTAEEDADCPGGTRYVTSGGRVLSATALGETYREAANKVYSTLGTIWFDGMFYRRDIGRDAYLA